MKKIVLVVIFFILFGIGVIIFLFERTVSRVNANITGFYVGSQKWSGQMIVTGDVHILGNLIVEPGTIVKFIASDDQYDGGEIPPDGFNDKDPSRLLAYERSHINLFVLGKMIAEGTSDQPITFTSAAAHPAIADWQAIDFQGNGSHLDHVIVEYSRNGVTPIGNQSKSIVEHSIIRHALWGCVSGGASSIQVLNNDISDCGHEGVDVQKGGGIIRGNHIRDSHSGIVVLAGDPIIEGNTITNVGDGIAILPGAHPSVADNTITLAPDTSRLEWRYQDFAYTMFDR